MRRRQPADEQVDPLVLAAAVPDAIAVRSDSGELVGWDESAARVYIAQYGLQTAFGGQRQGAAGQGLAVRTATPGARSAYSVSGGHL